MNAPNPIPKQGRKWQQVLDGARSVFLRDGFEGASVDDIAREACVSKATLYSYFPDKRLLFVEVAKMECRAQSEAAIAKVEEARDLRQALMMAAGQMVRFFLSDVGIQVHRIVVGESQRFPEVGHEFFLSGPAMVKEALRQFLQCHVEKGELDIADVPLAAEQFAELCKAGLHLPLVLGLRTRESISEEEIDRVIEGAVEMFMCRYGVKKS